MNSIAYCDPQLHYLDQSANTAPVTWMLIWIDLISKDWLASTKGYRPKFSGQWTPFFSTVSWSEGWLEICKTDLMEQFVFWYARSFGDLK